MVVRKPLLGIVFASHKRKGVLLLLKDGPRKIDSIMEQLSTSRQALLPQIRILEDHYLVTHNKDTYELTGIGKLIVDEMNPLLDTLEVFNIDPDYWGSHNIEFIPPHLLDRINELGKCDLIKPAITDMYEFNPQFYEHSKLSRSVSRVSTFFHPMYSKLYPELMKLGVAIYLVLSQEVLDRLQDKPEPDFAKLLENEQFNLYLYPKKIDVLTFAYNDHYLLINLLRSNGDTDNKHILCSNLSALEWGKELFQYYLKDSTPITKI